MLFVHNLTLAQTSAMPFQALTAHLRSEATVAVLDARLKMYSTTERNPRVMAAAYMLIRPEHAFMRTGTEEEGLVAAARTMLELFEQGNDGFDEAATEYFRRFAAWNGTNELVLAARIEDALRGLMTQKTLAPPGLEAAFNFEIDHLRSRLRQIGGAAREEAFVASVNTVRDALDRYDAFNA